MKRKDTPGVELIRYIHEWCGKDSFAQNMLMALNSVWNLTR